MRHVFWKSGWVAALVIAAGLASAQGLERLQAEFPNTDLTRGADALTELSFDGATRDSIPPVTDPVYLPVVAVTDMGAFEPVLTVAIKGDARAYPLSIMLWHEIVNEEIGGVPVLISYCPLCNSGVVFDRRVGDRVFTFGNTGRIRHFDMVMYDHQTESFWQQFTGQAIVGEELGLEMTPVPSRLESLALFRARWPDGQVLVPTDPGARPYGITPYRNMDAAGQTPRVLQGYDLPEGVRVLDYVVVVGNEAWGLDSLRSAGQIDTGDFVLRWVPGRNSIHDTQKIAEGRDLGNVTVQDRKGNDIAHDVVFAFSFAAFRPDGVWH